MEKFDLTAPEVGDQPLEELKSDDDSIDYENEMIKNFSIDPKLKLQFIEGQRQISPVFAAL